MKKIIASIAAAAMLYTPVAVSAASADLSAEFSDFTVFGEKTSAVSTAQQAGSSFADGINIRDTASKDERALNDLLGGIADAYGWYSDLSDLAQRVQDVQDYINLIQNLTMSDVDFVEITRDNVPADLEHAAHITMTEEDYEEMMAEPGKYRLGFIDEKAVYVRDGIVKGLGEIEEGCPTVDVTIYAGCKVMEKLDGVFMAVNTRNEALQQIDDTMTEWGYWNISDDEIVINQDNTDPPAKFNGKSGSDRYIIEKGSGIVYICDYCDNNSGDDDTIVFNYDTSSAKLFFYRKDDDLYIFDAANKNTVYVQNFFISSGVSKIEHIIISEDFVLSYDDVCKLTNILRGDDNDNEFTGYPEKNYVFTYKGKDTINTFTGDDVIFSGDDDDTVTTTGGNNYIFSGDGKDTITSNTNGTKIFGNINVGADVIFGEEDDDTITACGEKNVISGGADNDTLKACGGEAVFIYQKGDGKDTIQANSTNDILYFMDLKPEDVIIRQDNGFTVYLKDGSGSVNFGGAYQSGASKFRCDLDFIVFSDGTVWDLFDYLDQSRYFYGTDNSDDIIYKNNFTAYVYGYDGADNIQTAGGNDVICPDKGDDTINAGGGTDTLIFRRGDGHDIFDEDGRGCYPAGGDDTVLFEDIKSSEAYVVRDGGTITVKIKDSSDAVEMPGIYYSGASGPLHPIEFVKFADGVIWTFEDMYKMSENTVAITIPDNKSETGETSNAEVASAETTTTQDNSTAPSEDKDSKEDTAEKEAKDENQTQESSAAADSSSKLVTIGALPQAGINSMKTIGILLTSVMSAVTGLFMIRRSNIKNRK